MAAVKGEAFVVGDYLMLAGELSSEMFFIEEGLVGKARPFHSTYHARTFRILDLASFSSAGVRVCLSL